MTAPEGGPGGDAPLSWPRGVPRPPGADVDCLCEACARRWLVHESMAGFRLRCDCGAWVAVPGPAAAPLLALPPPADADALAPYGSAPGGIAPVVAPRPRELARVRGWDGSPLRPDADGKWSLRHAEVAARVKWTDGAIFELSLVLACFYVPALFVHFLTPPHDWAVWLPITSGCTGMLLLVVLGAWRTAAWQWMRKARLRYFAEAAGVAVLAALLAVLWVGVLKKAFPQIDGDDFAQSLGLPMALLLIAVFPAFFEELAFRGLIQTRFATLLGPVQGALAGGAAFALAHGVTAGLPFHMAGGIWLSFLRDRSGSVVPGMLAHALYNGTLVVVLW